MHFRGRRHRPKRFKNKRAELFWQLRKGLEQGKLALPDDDELLADLSALRYRFDQQGRIVLESKDEVRHRLGRSPDRGDAVALACAGSTQGGRPFVWLDGEVYDLNTGDLAQ